MLQKSVQVNRKILATPTVHCTVYSVHYYVHCGGGPTPFLPMEKCVFSHFFPWGKMEKKGKRIHFPLFPYTFFPIFPHGKKWENTHFSMGKNGVGPPHNV